MSNLLYRLLDEVYLLTSLPLSREGPAAVNPEVDGAAEEGAFSDRVDSVHEARASMDSLGDLLHYFEGGGLCWVFDRRGKKWQMLLYMRGTAGFVCVRNWWAYSIG